MPNRKLTVKSPTNRKLDLIFECLMHVAKKLLTDDELHEMLECLQAVNAAAMGKQVEAKDEQHG